MPPNQKDAKIGPPVKRGRKEQEQEPEPKVPGWLSRVVFDDSDSGESSGASISSLDSDAAAEGLQALGEDAGRRVAVCSVRECGRRAQGGGEGTPLCSSHQTCKVPGCSRPPQAGKRGRCERCQKRLRREVKVRVVHVNGPAGPAPTGGRIAGGPGPSGAIPVAPALGPRLMPLAAGNFGGVIAGVPGGLIPVAPALTRPVWILAAGPAQHPTPGARPEAAVVCKILGCRNPPQSGGRCAKHATRKLCTSDGCDTMAVRRGLCMKHGARGRCAVEGCKHVVVARKRCTKHGALGFCSVDGCTASVYARGLCYEHRPPKECNVQWCTNPVHTRGLCWRHGCRTICRATGCGRLSRKKSGLCEKHGARDFGKAKSGKTTV